ncbi:Tyrosine-protein kinase receptor Tie-1 [Phytophthora citrophthora]|uniref:Tyrosine-protein kinase receptor Tie-1 n=1 Tax=Phytophthora citrophthora TaxID=4793 RepID=A0AAD9LPT4_9STRA|nr:Tyrosine-protein kinase receptor Tie-1 [Phytophthora citrophthora]
MNLNIFEWFIAIEDVDYEDDALGYPGTFAQACRGTWLNEGKRQYVVVKTLHYITSDDDNEEDAFLQQLALWYKLPQHENILKLHGGNHERSHPFFVCEDAHHGNLLEFFEDGKHKEFFWPVFLGVVNGLKFLHDNNIVHRSLKGNNILIGDEKVAKIGDFGFSQVRGLSMRLAWRRFRMHFAESQRSFCKDIH